MDAHGPLNPRPGYLAPGVRVLREQMPTSPRGIQYARALMQRREPLPDGVRQAWSEGYDAELRFLDEHLSRLLERLPSLGIDEEDYVIILSDHGEYLGEHDLVGHNKDIYEEGIAIPLFMRGPGVEAGSDSTPVQTVDVARWILDGLGLEMLPHMDSTGDVQVAELYWNLPRNMTNKLMRQRFNRVRRAYIDGDRKLILGSDGSVERYDLGGDPRELRQLDEEIWDAAVERRSEDWLRAHTMGAGSEVSVSEDEALRALGYIE
jgi:arylsulfatase A-like enzyme